MKRSWNGVLIVLLTMMLSGSMNLKAGTRTGSSRRIRSPRATFPVSRAGRRAYSFSRHKLRAAARRSQKLHPTHPTVISRLAHMQIEPARVESIQQALVAAGELHGMPSGRWDTETHDAMARYQSAHGFGVTGLPDAKSLMKLGLGPHPLPQELDRVRASSLNPTASAAPGTSDEDSPATAPSTAANPTPF